MSVSDRSQPCRLPPGPPLPRWLQTAGFMFGGARFLEACRRRYGGAVTFGTLFDRRFVMVFDPELVRQVFQGSNEQLHAGEANALLGPILGERSVLLLDGAEHLRHRRLLLPPFHGRHMQLYEDAIRRATDAEIDSWPVGTEFPLLPSMQALTLRVILEAVFACEPGAAERELARRLRAFVEPLSERRSMKVILRLIRQRAGNARSEPFAARRRDVDELLFAEIARRRALPREQLEARDDVFSALLRAEDEDGNGLSDREVRDELLTLLVAGHETTATGLAWTFDSLLHDPERVARARFGHGHGPGESDGDRDPDRDGDGDGDGDRDGNGDRDGDRYLDAIVKESLRLRPVIAGVGRVVRGAPFQLGKWTIPIGVEINPSIRAIHRRPDLYPEPERFRPERFLDDSAPDTYTWLPFGGGTRRCLGASFALLEMRIVLGRVLERAALRPASFERERAVFRGITTSPRRGARVVLERAPTPATAAVV